MIVIMKMGATAQEIDGVVQYVEGMGFRGLPIYGEERTIVALIGDERPPDIHSLELLEGVERVVRVLQPFKLASRDFKPEDTLIHLNDTLIGGKAVVVMAGPCSVESKAQVLETAWAIKEAGVKIIRGGAFKPRTSPYSFQGLGREGLEILAEVKEETGLAVVSEVMSPNHVSLVAEYADILQVGARSMQNYSLLHAVGESHHPVLLKRGMMSTLEELLMSAEYVLSHGNYRVMLCERGIRTFEPYTRNTLDINAVPLLRILTHLPIIVDPSHGTGKWQLVGPISKAAVAAGADGLLIEVHPHPAQAFSDGPQSLKPDRFAQLMKELAKVAEAVDRKL